MLGALNDESRESFRKVNWSFAPMSLRLPGLAEKSIGTDDAVGTAEKIDIQAIDAMPHIPDVVDDSIHFAGHQGAGVR